jgi:NADH-quinone oxidoreductase subunit E
VNQLLNTYPDVIENLLAAYPPDHKRAAVMPLLHLAQKEFGYITGQAMQEIAEICGISVTEVASVVGFYTLFHDAPGGRVRLQVCTDVACKLRGASDYLNTLCKELGIQPGGTTLDGLVTVEEVKCLAACDKAPMFQSQIGDEIEYHENQTPAKTLEWLKLMTASMKREGDHE